MLGTDGLLPPGRHRVTAEDFKAHFVTAFPTSKVRAPLYQRWLQHRVAMLSFVPILSQWIDGSFVTDKEDPGDIDLVTVMEASAYDALTPVQQLLLDALMAGKATKAVWGMDSYAAFVVPPNHPHHAAVQAGANGWHHEWSRVRGRAGATKGYLEVTP